MNGQEDWTSAETTRTLLRIEQQTVASFTRLERRLDELTGMFVSRELHQQEQKAQDDKHVELAKWVTDIAASLERHSQNTVMKDTARWVVGTMVLVLVGLASVVTTLALH